MSNAPTLAIKGLVKRYHRRVALDGVDITVNAGVVQFLEVDGGVEACNQFGCTYSFNNIVADHTLDVLCN